jgi:hypothetical protein
MFRSQLIRWSVKADHRAVTGAGELLRFFLRGGSLPSVPVILVGGTPFTENRIAVTSQGNRVPPAPPDFDQPPGKLAVSHAAWRCPPGFPAQLLPEMEQAQRSRPRRWSTTRTYLGYAT